MWTGWIQAPASGTFTFYLESDDGSRLYIDGVLRVDNGGGAVDAHRWQCGYGWQCC